MLAADVVAAAEVVAADVVVAADEPLPAELDPRVVVVVPARPVVVVVAAPVVVVAPARVVVVVVGAAVVVVADMFTKIRLLFSFRSSVLGPRFSLTGILSRPDSPAFLFLNQVLDSPDIILLIYLFWFFSNLINY